MSTVCTNLDRPDPLFVDANCDGIDGDPATAIFVAPPPFGSDTNPGTLLQPLANLAAAVQLAGRLIPTKDVYVAQGTYVFTNSLVLASKVGLFGLYDGTTNWTRAATNDTIIQGPSTAIIATNLTGESRLEGFHIVAADAVQPGESSYGIRVYRCTGVVVVRGNTITSGNGGGGQNGSDGDAGFPGGGGYSGNSGNDGGGGRQGGSSLCGRSGGRGGNGGYASGGTPGLGGDGWNGIPFSPGTPGVGGAIGAPCDKGGRGGVGHGGADGVSGTNAASAGGYGTIQDGLFTPDVGQAGQTGTPGDGGGGAGGGGANTYSIFGCFLDYGGGGASGSGGGGGHSIGIFVDQFSTETIGFNQIFLGLPGLGGAGGTNSVLGAAPKGPTGIFRDIVVIPN